MIAEVRVSSVVNFICDFYYGSHDVTSLFLAFKNISNEDS